MKCFKCVAELSEDAKFCSYCGNKIEKSVSISNTVQKIQNFFESNTNASERMNAEKTNGKISINDKIKKKSVDAWNKLSTYGKLQP